MWHDVPNRGGRITITSDLHDLHDIGVSGARAPVTCPGTTGARGRWGANRVPATGLVYRMRVALRDWVMHDTPPPPSQWPTMAKKTLVDPTAEPMGFPSGVPGIPDSIFLPENFIFPVFDYDWGPESDHSEASAIPANAPSLIRHGIKMKVPRVDADGNELGEVPTVQRDALLGTYLGGTSLLGQATLAMTTD